VVDDVAMMIYPAPTLKQQFSSSLLPSRLLLPVLLLLAHLRRPGLRRVPPASPAAASSRQPRRHRRSKLSPVTGRTLGTCDRGYHPRVDNDLTHNGRGLKFSDLPFKYQNHVVKTH